MPSNMNKKSAQNQQALTPLNRESKRRLAGTLSEQVSADSSDVAEPCVRLPLIPSDLRLATPPKSTAHCSDDAIPGIPVAHSTGEIKGSPRKSCAKQRSERHVRTGVDGVAHCHDLVVPDIATKHCCDDVLTNPRRQVLTRHSNVGWVSRARLHTPVFCSETERALTAATCNTTTCSPEVAVQLTAQSRTSNQALAR